MEKEKISALCVVMMKIVFEISMVFIKEREER
jgi:hypothetical protein